MKYTVQTHCTVCLTHPNPKSHKHGTHLVITKNIVLVFVNLRVKRSTGTMLEATWPKFVFPVP